MELSQSVLIDKSFLDFEIFKKCKTVTFYANCSYSIDLSKITEKDITIDNANKQITIFIPNPEIFSLNIDESKTKYSEPELGLLRFGDIQLSSEESLYTQAISNAKDSLEKLIYNLTEENYTISIKVK